MPRMTFCGSPLSAVKASRRYCARTGVAITETRKKRPRRKHSWCSRRGPAALHWFFADCGRHTAMDVPSPGLADQLSLVHGQNITLWMIEKKRLAASLLDSCGTTRVVCSSLYMLVESPALSWICSLRTCLLLQGVLKAVGAIQRPRSAEVGLARQQIAVPQTSWL